MTSTTDTQFSPYMEAFGDTLTQLAEGASAVARESTKTYVGGLNAIVEQQRLAAHASQRWISGVISAQSNFRQRLAGQAAATGAESRSNAPAGATAKQGNAVTRTPRRATPKRSKSAATGAGRPGPAKWTSEAYEPLTAAEIIEKLPQLSERELVEVETYEKAHQSRQTVLQKITSLRGQES